jgi:diguanylate cyclase (GGDEF)-like protein/PAS domain S-box-containing protein
MSTDQRVCMNENDFVEARFRILDCMPFGVFALRDDFSIVFWNRCLEQWTKLSREQILGHKFDDHFLTLNKPLLRLRLQTIFEGGPPAIFSSQLHQYVVPVALRSGKMRSQHTIVSAVRAQEPDKHYALFAVQDVTDLTNRLNDYLLARQQADAELEERRRVENELREQKGLFQSVLESLTARIGVINSQGIITSCNGAWQRFAGEHAQSLGVGSNYLQTFLGGEDQKQRVRMYEGLRAVLDARIESYQEEYQCHLSHSDAWYIMTVTPLVGGSRGAVVSHIDITARKRAERQIEHVALHDNLTGLPNRQLFMDRMTQALASAKRSQRRLAIMFLDLNQFKRINDSLGHEAGDVVLIEVGKRLRESVRGSDTVARIGGDEFALIMTDIKRAADAAAVAQKISRILCTPVRFGEQEVQVGVSIGISIYPNDGTSIASLLKSADSAMYATKGSRGETNFRFYSEQN